MESKQLQHIKKTYEDIQAGISNPVHINTAYAYLPQYVENTPMIAKIRAINRFMMLVYHDELKHATSEPEHIELQDDEMTPKEFSIVTMENKHMQSHSEDDIQGFLTLEEKQSLASNKSGTEFKRTRSSNGTRKPRK